MELSIIDLEDQNVNNNKSKLNVEILPEDWINIVKFSGFISLDFQNVWKLNVTSLFNAKKHCTFH